MDKKSLEYYLGLDVGTDNVGWSAIYPDFRVARARGKDLWGVRMFTPSQTCVKRRTFRSTRRRMLRRKTRISLLQMLMADDIMQVDQNFFARLKESERQYRDKTTASKYTYFCDENYTDVKFLKEFHEFHTIYHLRRDLIFSDQKKDIRLVYLALHHIIKYRGHFIYEGQNLDTNKAPNDMFAEINSFLEQVLLEKELNLDDIDFNSIMLSQTTRKAKAEILLGKFVAGKPCDAVKEMVNAMLGMQFDLNKIFGDDACENIENKKTKFSDSGYDDKIPLYVEELDDNYRVLEALKNIYNYLTLLTIKQGEEFLCQGMVKKYDKHNADLKKFKTLFRLLPQENYNDWFVSRSSAQQENTKKSANASAKTQKSSAVKIEEYNCIYDNYVGRDNRKNIDKAKKMSRDDFYAAVKSLLEKLKKQADLTGDAINAINEISCDMENYNFLPLQVSIDNCAIPYQLNLTELCAIVRNQSKFYPSLQKNADKLEKILTFRIPYYVGPLSKEKTNFAWAVRRNGDKIYPWNFDDVVDKNASEDLFIKRMTSKCSYLIGEDVLPRNSILYCEYALRNELNKIRIDGEYLEDDEKEAVVTKLFAQRSKVGEKDLINFLISENYRDEDVRQALFTGYQKEKEFSSNLKPYIAIKNIVGDLADSQRDAVEQIIEWATILTNAERLGARISKNYSNIFSKEQIQGLKGLRFSGWGKLSKALLCEITGSYEGQVLTVMDVLRHSHLNLMEILNRKELGFDKAIERFNSDKLYGKKDIEMLEDIVCPSNIKRPIWQSLLIIDEITKVLGAPPKKIFIEVAKGGSGEKKRTQSRFLQLKKTYKTLIEEEKSSGKNKAELQELSKKLDKKDEKALQDSEKLLLYFLQKGKCMYTEKPLDIEQLGLYHVDHILPQSYIKDDSIDNKVLVTSIANERKADNLLLSQDIINERQLFWENLKKSQLMSDKKFTNLIRTKITDKDAVGFVARQLVENRQSTKALAQVLKRKYPDIQICTVKARIVSSFRKANGLEKCREINYFHHAHDAYLNAVLGNVLDEKIGFEPQDFVRRNNVVKDMQKLAIENIKNSKDNDYLQNMFRFDITAHDQKVWRGQESVEQLRKQLDINSVLFSIKTEEGHSEFYDRNVYRKNSKVGVLIPKKTVNLAHLGDTALYGGYKGQLPQMFVAISYSKIVKKKETRAVAIERLPLYLKFLLDNDENIIKYFEGKQLNYKGRVYQFAQNEYANVEIIARLPLNSFLLYKDKPVILTGNNGTQLAIYNGAPLYFSQKQTAKIKAIIEATLSGEEIKNVAIVDEMLKVVTDKYEKL
ncbi:MAG: type II CRISPR RNA-guided endonuclease Cas9, partial [Clostridia bacterium]